MNSSDNNLLIARQPILGRNEQLYGYEILFRDASQTAEACPSHATASVILNSLLTFGLKDLLGGHKGFINVGTQMLFDDAIEILPTDIVGIELLETIEPTTLVVERCRKLKEMGFVLSLDDHTYSPAFDELYNIVDIVKIDVMATPLQQIPAVLEQLRPFSLQLLAEKIETYEVFNECLELGFTYFQGYYFAKPSIFHKKKMSEDIAAMLAVLRLIIEDAQIGEIEQAFKKSPNLMYKLLLLVNSVALCGREKITGIRHALTMVGRLQIRRWIQLALFISDGSEKLDNPLVDLAAVRAGLMEQLAMIHPNIRTDKEAPELAFMAGILSLMVNIFDVPMEKFVQELGLNDDLAHALVSREGIYGQLLQTTELIEEADFPAVSEFLCEMGISTEDVFDMQMNAYLWRKK